MSLSVHVGPWADEAKGVLKACERVDDELRLCLDRGSDSDSQLELNRSLTELIESITCKGDSGDEDLEEDSGRRVVAEIVERILDRVEQTASGAPRRRSVELTEAREIDGEGSRDTRHPGADSPKKVRRKRDRSDHGRKKSRRRSTSCSTTSSACSDVSRKHRRKHKQHRRKEEDPSPRVNPIFLWVKQDDTRIVEVLCEDYDKRNRLRLTKTAHGWRAMPRTERLDSALSRSSLELSPTSECPPPLVSPAVIKTEPAEELPHTKEKKAKRCLSRKNKNKRCDRKKDKGFNHEDNYVDEYKNVDVVNNNHCSISNNNKIIENSVILEPNLSEPSLRSFGYKKACHGDLGVDNKNKTRDNKAFDDFDVYTFVPTPKTDFEDNNNVEDAVSDMEPEIPTNTELEIKPEPKEEIVEPEPDLPKTECNVEEIKVKLETSIKSPEPTVEETKREEELKSNDSEALINMEICESNPDTENRSPKQEEECESEKPSILSDSLSSSIDLDSKLEEKEKQHEEIRISCESELKSCDSDLKSSDLDSKCHDSQQKSCEDLNPMHSQNVEVHEESINEQLSKHQSPLKEAVDQPQPETPIIDNLEDQSEAKSVECEPVVDSKLCIDSNVIEDMEDEQLDQDFNDLIEEEIDEDDDEEETPPEVILPEPHLQTPEPSPQPVPEHSINEPESSLTEISLLPDTSLDSDTIHLPDTTTKSDTSLLISTNISLGQKLSIKESPDITIDTSLIGGSSLANPKSVHATEISHHSHSDIKASMLHDAEIERQITADLDEDHLLAIEEILQGEECVEDFDDDDLPEEYPVSHESPVNLVIDLKSKEQVDNSGIPLSLRTDDFLEIFPSPISMKEQSELLPPITTPKKNVETVEKLIPPAHQQSKTKFLESILSCPKRCHNDSDKKGDSSVQQEPLYLGVSRKSASPTVSSSDGRKFSSPELEPKPKRLKVEDITLKTILNRNSKDSLSKTKINKSKDTEDTLQSADSTTKSRLLELLTNENDEHINKLDPLTQLKEVLSDPDLNVPDPLLVPRARLPALVANPAKEIPRLLAMKSENLSYPKLLTDPDLLVVSLSHLQSLLQAAGKEEEMLKYQQHAQLLQQQMKQEQPTLDAATATALNQMMWLPYLSQLEAAAMACGNTQDFMTMLNMVFPSGTYPQMNPYMMSSSSPGINAYDYKSQMEFQQAFALWNEAMMQAATNQFAAQTLGSSNNSSNISSKLYQNYQDTKYNPKLSHTNSQSKQDPKHTAARTSPITLNYQQNKYRSSQYPYTSMFSIPTSTPTTSLASGGTAPYRTTQSSQSQQSYQSSRQRGYNYNSGYSSMRPPTIPSSPSVPKVDPAIVGPISTSDLYKSQQKHSSSSSSCKSLMNILSKPKQSEVKNVNRVYPTSTTMLPKETTIRTTSSVRQEPPKLKVKQPQHLVDPNSRPKLLNFDEHGEVGSTTGSLTPHLDEAHPNLWHPLFSRPVGSKRVKDGARDRPTDSRSIGL
ncbi:hypothetical protein J6590_094007 [Homalodisca vitripennis]|nr:hypothetical protein J6590_094007 [Homalodisca vitripennis]